MAAPQNNAASDFLLQRDSELVIGLVAPTGTDLKSVADTLKRLLQHPYGYSVNPCKITDLMDRQDVKPSIIDADLAATEYNASVNARMDAGNELRKKSKRNDFLALLAIKAIAEKREIINYRGIDSEEIAKTEPLPLKRTVHIIHQLKHPEEVRTLRKVYGTGFYLLGVHSSYEKRVKRFVGMGVDRKEAEDTLTRDQEEDESFGQHTRDTFALSDAYITTERLPDEFEYDINRILEIWFGNPHRTPSRDEYCMFLAYAASLRSADLSRQVGAVLMSSSGDITATGANEVPKAGGGQYWSEEKPRCRDFERGEDSNDIQRRKIVAEAQKLVCEVYDVERNSGSDKELDRRFRASSLWEITEYGRSVHAEMEAILCCARAGISTRNGILYTTTFPCHNCARHIVDAGIKRVVYVEPYTKSRAPELLSDSIYIVGEPSAKRRAKSCIEPHPSKKVRFEPFIGISARRFVDLFSLSLSAGHSQPRKVDGRVNSFKHKGSDLKIPLAPTSYLERELVCGRVFEEILDQLV